MNILGSRRKSNIKINLRTLILLIFSLMMTTFAWFTYTKVLEPALNIHLVSWDMEYYIGEQKQENVEDGIKLDIDALYPAMPERNVTIDIYNNGEALVDIGHQVKSITILETTYEVIQEGETATKENYITLAEPVLTLDEKTGEEIYIGDIVNDLTKFPFTIQVQYSSQVKPATQDSDGKKVPGQGYLSVIVNWTGNNDELDSEWGYKAGEFLETTEENSAISIVLSVDAYQAEKIDIELPNTEETIPYLPTGFSYDGKTTLSDGLTIADGAGNQYVWVEVPRNTTVYSAETLALNFATIEGDENLKNAYKAIEDDLHDYTGTEYTDVHSGNDASTGLTSGAYTKLKEKMLKSVYENGGFYVGKYETGTKGTYRDFGTDMFTEYPINETPVIQANAYPYGFVTVAQAQSLATRMSSGQYTSSLMFGIQWDLILKYLESKGVASNLLYEASTSWGNYSESIFTIEDGNVSYNISKEQTMALGEWLAATEYKHEKYDEALLTTGAKSEFSKQGIYDLAGNVLEWTLQYSSSTTYPTVGRGGTCSAMANVDSRSNGYGCYPTIISTSIFGFRVSIF